MFADLLYLGYLYLRHPQRVTKVGLVHIDQPVTEPEPSGD